MKIETITKTNQKGQIVIPKAMREALGIDTGAVLNLTLRGSGIYIFPVDEVLTKIEAESSYLKILEKTQGSWAKEDWGFLRNKRRKTELSASKKRREVW